MTDRLWMRWEHKKVTLVSVQMSDTELDRYGDLGWELCGIDSRDHVRDFFFKRPAAVMYPQEGGVHT